MKKTAGILLAAGLSSRMEAFKPMLPFGASTVSRHIVGMLKQLGVEPVVVVTGFRAEELEKHLSSAGVRFVRNERYRETQMFDSVRLGIHAVSAECDRVMILPVDIPAIMPETIGQVLMIDAPLVRTVCGGEPGHPILLRSEVAETLCDYEGPGGLRGAMENSGIPITSLEVEDEGIYRDMDTREQYQELLDWNYSRGQGYPVRPQVQVRLVAGEPFYGPGTQELLSWIGQTGSIQEACSRMGLSYSKARRMIKTLERQLGFVAVERRAGGSGGGSSDLTERGRELLQRYSEMVAKVQDCTDTIYQDYFGGGF